MRGWICKKTRIGPVLNIKVCCRDDRYNIEVQIPSLLQDHTCSWVRTVNGVDKYVTESVPTAKEEDTASGKPIAKARPRQKPTETLTSVSIPVTERKWIDIETQRSHDHKCYEESKAITRFLRHCRSVPRGSDGAIRCSDIIEEFEEWRRSTVLRSGYLKTGHQTLAKGGGIKKRFQYCLNPNSANQFLYLREIQFQETMLLILHCKTMYCYRKDLPSTSTTLGTRIEFYNKKRINSRGEQDSTRNMVHKIHKAKKQDHLGNHQAIRKAAEKLAATPWNIWSTSFRSRAAEYDAREQSQEVDREVREPQTLRIIHSGFESDAEDQLDRRLGQHRELRILRKVFQTAMS